MTPHKLGLGAIAAALLSAAAPAATAAAPALFGPLEYKSFADSPFQPFFPASFAYFHLEDFESATPTPGYLVDVGIRIGPSGFTDSVDADGPTAGSPTGPAPAGNINGTGTDASSWLNNTSVGLTFSFIASQLGGRLPTHVGIVWTDVGNVSENIEAPLVEFGRSHVTVVAYDANGDYLADVGTGFGATLGDGSVNGGTDEDRFFGIVSAQGISRFEIYTAFSNDWEVDHLQYGALNPIPEPEQWLLMALGVGAVAWRVRRRQQQAASRAAPR